MRKRTSRSEAPHTSLSCAGNSLVFLLSGYQTWGLFQHQHPSVPWRTSTGGPCWLFLVTSDHCPTLFYSK